MATAKSMLTVAAGEIGYAETPVNRTKYGAWYGMDGSAWCAMFVSWCAVKSGNGSIIPKHSYTPNGVAWFKKRNRWTAGTRGIRMGDICYFDFPGDGVNRVSHVGVVESVRSDGTIITIEGNTSTTDNRNGGSVMRRARNPIYIVGYGRPQYDAETTPKPVSYRIHRVLKRGMSGADVRKLQAKLGITADGAFGAKTEAAVKKFQKAHKLPVDGTVGKQTALALGWKWR